MSRLFNGSSEYLTFATSPIGSGACTLVAWVYPTTLGASHDVLVLADSVASVVNGYRLNITSTATRAIAVGNSSTSIATTTAPLANRWQLVGAVFAGTTSRTAYLNGVPGAANPATLTYTVPFSNTSISRLTAGIPNHVTGAIGHAAAWNVLLTNIEMAMLAAGVLPTQIRPESLVLYYPLSAESQFRDRIIGTQLTAIGSPKEYGETPQLSLMPRHSFMVSQRNVLLGGEGSTPVAANPNANERYLAGRYGITP